MSQQLYVYPGARNWESTWSAQRDLQLNADNTQLPQLQPLPSWTSHIHNTVKERKKVNRSAGHHIKQNYVDPEVKGFPCRYCTTVTHIIFCPVAKWDVHTDQKAILFDQAERNTGIEMHSIKMTRGLNIYTHAHTHTYGFDKGYYYDRYIEHLEVGTNRWQNSNR